MECVYCSDTRITSLQDDTAHRHPLFHDTRELSGQAILVDCRPIPINTSKHPGGAVSPRCLKLEVNVHHAHCHDSHTSADHIAFVLVYIFCAPSRYQRSLIVANASRHSAHSLHHIGLCMADNALVPVQDLESLGLTQDLPRHIEHFADKQLRNGNLAGLVTLISRRGVVAQIGAYGHQDIGLNLPMHANSIFRIASLTKPITTVAALKLWEQGKFNLDDEIRHYLPDYSKLKVIVQAPDGSTATTPIKCHITFRHLLTHTTGFSYEFTADATLQRGYAEARLFKIGEPIAESIDRLAKLPLNFQPGSAFRYGVSTDVLGYLIELMSDISLDDFFKTRIFDPLGMRDTSHLVPSDKADRFASLYKLSDQGTLLREQAACENPAATGKALCHGGGGLTSTASDYYRFLTMLLNGGEQAGMRILKRSTVAMMTSNQLPKEMLPLRFIYGPNYDSKRCGYGGYGFGVNAQIGHGSLDPASTATFGCTGAHNQFFWVDPLNELIGIFLVQLLPFARHPFEGELKKIVYASITRP